MDYLKTRNFAIIAHIDHGKSTLADRILELTNAVTKHEMKEQLLDSMDLEQERGITIKLNAVQVNYKGYTLHLIDTPGHVDFAYEVSRSLAACEGAILLVDATQGVEAQTISNIYLALENNLEVIPVINKIDLPSADVGAVKSEIEAILGIDASNAIEISAKTGLNVEKVLDKILEVVPPPKKSDVSEPLKALIFDSFFDTYRGVVLLVRIFSGAIKVGSSFQFMSTQKTFNVTELGVRTPSELKKNTLEVGEVGFIAASIRSAHDVTIGDTITLVENPALKALPGYRHLKPVVFVGFYPIDNRDFTQLKDALEKISLSDSSIVYEPESSLALGSGFRVGFLGMLHMEILQERLFREFNINLITTSPSVEIRIKLNNGKKEAIKNPSLLPDPNLYQEISEPFISATIIVPEQYIGVVMDLCQSKRGIYQDLEFIDNLRHKITYSLPLMEVVFDFFDQLKSATKGYASFDYEIGDYQVSNLVRVNMLLNGNQVDAFTFIAHKDFAQKRSKDLANRLKEAIPRHNFEIPVQAAIGGKIIARETIKAFRKDVTAKLYGGDRTRRDKLLKKQKAGKKRARAFGKVEVPQDVFVNVLKSNIK